MDELRKKEKEKQAKKELCKLATKAADPGAEPESTEGEDENFEEYTEGEDESCETAEEGNPLKLSESKKNMFGMWKPMVFLAIAAVALYVLPNMRPQEPEFYMN